MLPGNTSLLIRFNKTLLYMKEHRSALPAKSSSLIFAPLSMFAVAPSHLPCLGRWTVRKTWSVSTWEWHREE